MTKIDTLMKDKEDLEYVLLLILVLKKLYCWIFRL